MMKHVAISLAIAVIAHLPSQGSIKNDLVPLQGRWDVVEAPGMKGIPRGMAGLIFKGDKYEGFTENKIDERGTVSLDTSHKPASIALVIADGDDKGKIQLGLIEVSGDSMRLVLNSPGDPKLPLASSKDWVTLKRSK